MRYWNIFKPMKYGFIILDPISECSSIKDHTVITYKVGTLQQSFIDLQIEIHFHKLILLYEHP